MSRVIVVLERSIKSVTASWCNMDEISTEMQHSIAIAEILLRLSALERILKDKGIVTDEEYKKVFDELTAKMGEVFKQITGADMSNVISFNKN